MLGISVSSFGPSFCSGSRLMPRMRKPLARWSTYALSSHAISSEQGMHQLAQKTTSTTSPLKLARSICSPFKSVPRIAGAGLPIMSSWFSRVAQNPLTAGFSDCFSTSWKALRAMSNRSPCSSRW